ncbi:MAG: sulfotransferase [Pirellulales bacterium]
MNKTFEGAIVIGSPRSGTTLLRRLLDAHPAIVCPSETNLLGAASRFLEESEIAGGLHVGVVPGLGFSGFSEDEVLSDLREFLFSYWRRILAKCGKELWVEKTAVDVFHLDAIERLCADQCRYICMSRHALDVVCSMKDLSIKMDAFLTEMHKFVKSHEQLSEAFAQAWCVANDRMLKFVNDHPDWCIQLKYENLVADPAAEMDRIYGFLGVEKIAETLVDDALNKKDSVGLGDWKTYGSSEVSTEQIGRYTSLDGWTIKRLAPLVNPLLKRLGYEPVVVSDIVAQQDSRRVKELGQYVAAMKMTGGDQSKDDE